MAPPGICTVLMACVLTMLAGQAWSQKVSTSKVSESSVQFEILNAGFPVDGSISGLEVNIEFDHAQLANSRIEAHVDPATIHTGIAIRDKHLKRSDYLDVEQYPRITLSSTSLSKADRPGHYKGHFDLRIKGTTKEVEIPFEVSDCGSGCRFRGEFRINRLDFGIGDKSVILADSVRVILEVSIPR